MGPPRGGRPFVRLPLDQWHHGRPSGHLRDAHHRSSPGDCNGITGCPTPIRQNTADYASRVLHRLLESATDCVCSYSIASGDNPQTPTGLLAHLPEGSPGTDPGWGAKALCRRGEPSQLTSDPVPPVVDDERVSGGSGTIQRQLQEPFTAFVRGRLGVEWMQAITPGLSPRMRGQHRSRCAVSPV